MLNVANLISQATTPTYENELSIFFVLTENDFKKIDLKNDFFVKYFETKDVNKVVKRLGYILENNTLSSIKYFKIKKFKEQFFIYHNNLKIKPTIISYAENIEVVNYNKKFTPESSQNVLYKGFKKNNVRYIWGYQENLNFHTKLYFFSIEEELPNPMTPLVENVLKIVEKWNLEFLYNFEDIPLDSVPFSEPHIKFRHSAEFCNMNILKIVDKKYLKPKVDGIRFMAVWDNDFWQVKSNLQNKDNILEAIKKVPPFLNHYVCLFECTQDQKKNKPIAILTDILYARNSPNFRNSLYHECSNVRKVSKPLVKVDLYTSLQMLKDIEEKFHINTNTTFNYSYKIDGFLSIYNHYTYTKIKNHQTIELYYNKGSFYSANSEFLLFHFEIIDPDKLLKSGTGIFELEICLRKKTLTVKRKRLDKNIPDNLNKVFKLLNNNVYGI